MIGEDGGMFMHLSSQWSSMMVSLTLLEGFQDMQSIN